jgi:monoterpene epsilon-lactone hydrolase
MTSIQARIAKKFMQFQLSGWSTGSIAEQRSRQEKTARFARLPRDIHCRPVVIHAIPAEWIEGANADAGVILYLHGGAYALGSINVHREMVARLAGTARIKALAINYRLAPEHPFPAALEDAIAAYHWLLTQGYDPASIIIAGDSAGGGLAIAVLVALRDAGERLPAGAVCISPWVDLALTGASIHENASIDPVLDAQSLAMYAGYYGGDCALTSPLISPLYADLEGLPSLLIQVCTHEILLDDAKRIAENARQAGVDVTLETWDGMFHLFQIIPFLPETQRAIEHIAGFVANTFSRFAFQSHPQT